MKFQLLTIALLLQTSLVFCQVSLKDISLKNGAFSIGYNQYITFDSTRTYSRIYDWNNESGPRPISVSVWYPAIEKTKKGESMKVVNYMEILKAEEEWEHLPNEQILNWFYYPNTAANRRHLEEQTAAFRKIKAADGKFPVVIYAPSYQASSIENFALCEFLASHGYVVVSSPSRGTENRLLAGGTEKDMETQARDIEFLLNEIFKIPNTNKEQIATMGFSFGGLSNVLAQMRNDKIKANVSLDGSIRYQFSTLQKSPFANIKKVTVPFMHMAQKDIPEQVLKEDKLGADLNDIFDFYDSLQYSKAYSLKFHHLTHSYFSTLGILFQTRDKRQDKTDKEIMESYRLISVYTLNFLNAYLKNDTKALSFLENNPEVNGINKGLISRRTKEPNSKPFSFQDFNELAAVQEYANLQNLYTSLLLKHPSLKLPEGNLNNLGLQLVFNPATEKSGINVFLLATTIYPESSNLFDSLAEGYLHIGNKKNAVENFKKSLKLNAQNQNAIDRLKQLKKTSH
jgi:dienelactone hydrolase